MFQSLIGRLKTGNSYFSHSNDTVFQSLIGRLKTVLSKPSQQRQIVVSIPYR